MELIDILGQLKAIRTDLSGGQFIQAWQDTLPLQQSLIDLAKNIGFKAGPGDEATAKEIKAVLDECCQLAASPPKGAEFGKLGDGKLLAQLIELFKQLAPIIIPLIIH